MPFAKSIAKIPPHEVVVIDHNDETAERPARAIFNDETYLEFPRGVKFVPDMHIPERLQGVPLADLDHTEHPDLQPRLLIQRPPVKDAAGRDKSLPNVWLPMYVQKEYVLAILDRLAKGV